MSIATTSITVAERRESLLGWLRERSAHDGLTASEIVDVIGHPYAHIPRYVYDSYPRRAACLRDLQALERDGHVARTGRPARWYVG